MRKEILLNKYSAGAGLGRAGQGRAGGHRAGPEQPGQPAPCAARPFLRQRTTDTPEPARSVNGSPQRAPKGAGAVTTAAAGK